MADELVSITEPDCWIDGVPYVYGSPEWAAAYEAFNKRTAEMFERDAEAQEEYDKVRPLNAEEVLIQLIQATDMVESLPDEVVARMQTFFPTWSSTASYVVGDKVTYGEGDGFVWRCLQTHQAQESWTPEAAPSLWAKVLTNPDEPQPWEQPSSTNPYMRGDRVMHNGHTWESDIDNNVWEPGVYGWSIVSD